MTPYMYLICMCVCGSILFTYNVSYRCVHAYLCVPMCDAFGSLPKMILMQYAHVAQPGTEEVAPLIMWIVGYAYVDWRGLAHTHTLRSDGQIEAQACSNKYKYLYFDLHSISTFCIWEFLFIHHVMSRKGVDHGQ